MSFDGCLNLVAVTFLQAGRRQMSSLSWMVGWTR
jgi:hypothetical protein